MRKRILRLAIPNIVSNITVPLLGLADLILLGHLSTETHIGAIALGGTIFNFIYWGFGFLRMGTVGFTAQAHGEKDQQKQALTLWRAMFVGAIAAFFLIVTQWPIAKIGFYLLEGSSDVEFFAEQYFFIRIFAAPATLSLYSLSGWFLGLQNSKAPMLIAIIVNVVNIIANFVFIYFFKMHSSGVALGTVFAQYSGVVVAGIIILRKYKFIFQYFNLTEILRLSEIKKFMKVNFDIFIRTLVLIFVLSYFTSKSASYGDTILAANTILLQFFMLFSYFMDGFAHSAEALTGTFRGAKKKKALLLMITQVFRWGGIISAVFTFVYFFFSDAILYIFTSDEQIVTEAMAYTQWVLIIPVISVASFIWDGIFIGASWAKQMRNSMLLSAMFFTFVIIFISQENNHKLWFAFVLFLTARSIIQSIQFFVVKRNQNFDKLFVMSK